ncbi:MAG: dihydrolipoyl dehydrogenase [Sterolibacterium sp.]
MPKQFDVVVIGGGPGGYVAAIRAAQLGLNAACVESQPYADPKGEVRLGGTCLNVGCIPSKALLQSSEYFDQANHSFVMHGISFDNVKMDVTTMMRRKDNIVTQLTGGIRSLFKKNKVTLLVGHGKFVPSPQRIPTTSSSGTFEGQSFSTDAGRENEPWQLEISGPNGSEMVEAKHVIIATGSKPRHLPGVPVDNKVICDNVGALSLEGVPKRLGVIGAGVIGLELGSVWKRLGAEVTMLEALPDFLSAADQAIANEAWKIFTRKQGLNILLGVRIGKVSIGKKVVSIDYETGDEKTATLECDKLIVSVGRIPNTDGLGCEGVGLKLDERGRVAVDGHCRTNLENVWAVGDVVPGPMLAHKGMEEGVMVAELIAGQAGHVDYNTVPWVIYTHPEIAWVGRTEQQLKRAGVDYRVGQIPFMANGRALGQGDTTGFVKMLADTKTDRILGVHVIGNNASELIAEAVVAMEFGAASEDIARICHAHPTLSEAMHEAALAVDKRPLHF